MNVSLRPYLMNEFEESCRIRGISTEEGRKRWRSRFEKSGDWDDHYFQLAIDLNGQMVGDLQVRHCPQTMPAGVLEMGVEIDPDKRGKGIGTAAVRLCADRFLNSGYHRISGGTAVTNFGMIRAFEKAGWIREGIFRGLFNENGVLHDYVNYSIIAER